MRVRIIPILLTLLAVTASGQGFELSAEEAVTVAAKFAEDAAPRRGRAVLEVTITMAEGWHVYGANEKLGVPTRLEIVDAGGLVAEGAPEIPPGEPKEFFGETQHTLAGEAVLRQAFTVPEGTTPGEVTVRARVSYQPCTDTQCFDAPPAEVSAKLTILEEVAAAVEPAAAEPTRRRAGGGGDAGLIGFLLAAVGAGLLALVMPCTYPMIPITISFFTKQGEARGGRVLPLSLAYGAGIIAIFVLIGILIGPAIITFATHPWTNLIIALIFIAFALVLFGVWNLQPPRFLMNMAGKASTQGGYLGVFLMGAALVVTSFTCTFPFVGSLLSLGATGGGLGRVALGMATFGATMAIPFVFLSLVPSALSKMPSSGEWMHTIKVFLGFVELAAALKFLSNADLGWNWEALPLELFLYLYAGIFGVAGLFLLGRIHLKGDSAEGIGPTRLVFGLATLLLAIYCVYGATGHKLDRVMIAIAPPYSGREAVATAKASEGRVIISDDYEAALARARAEGKPLFINFTGVT
jgi:thiol:disulfide interchange protein DsbD